MAVKTNHSPKGCSFRWGGAAIAQTKHTWKGLITTGTHLGHCLFWINVQQTNESEIPASFSKPGIERRYIGSHRRFVCERSLGYCQLIQQITFSIIVFRSASQINKGKQNKQKVTYVTWTWVSVIWVFVSYSMFASAGYPFGMTPNSSPHTYVTWAGVI